MTLTPDTLAMLLYIPMLAVSLPQLVWTGRVVKRVRLWLSQERTGLELVPFASASRWGVCGWSIGIVLAIVFLNTANVRRDGNMVCLIAIVALWCLLQLIVSGLSSELCRQITRFAAMRQLDEQGLAEAAKLFPEGFGPTITAESLHRRVNILGRVALAWLIFLLGCAGVVFLSVFASVLGSIGSALGQFVLLFTAFVVPGFLALLVIRGTVTARAQRTQFLWFLAMTTEKKRPLATELMAWGQSHPGRIGARVLEVARDIGVGDSLTEALAHESGLLSPSDLMSVRVAEQTGTLAETLRDCAVRQTQALKGDATVASASGTAIWLWSVGIVAVNVVSFVMYYIVPKFKMIFLGFGTELPKVTVLMITVSDVVAAYGGVLFPLFLVFSGVLLWSCSEAYLGGWSETWLSWQLGIGRRAEIPRLLRRLRGAVVGKLPWASALQPMVMKHPRGEIRARLERVLGRVSAGMGVWPAMRDSGLLNARDVSLLEMAERANNLEWALAALAESKERTMHHRGQVLLTLVVPACTLAAGFLVLLICTAFFMPLVKLLHDLS